MAPRDLHRCPYRSRGRVQSADHRPWDYREDDPVAQLAFDFHHHVAGCRPLRHRRPDKGRAPTDRRRPPLVEVDPAASLCRSKVAPNDPDLVPHTSFVPTQLADHRRRPAPWIVVRQCYLATVRKVALRAYRENDRLILFPTPIIDDTQPELLPCLTAVHSHDSPPREVRTLERRSRIRDTHQHGTTLGHLPADPHVHDFRRLRKRTVSAIRPEGRKTLEVHCVAGLASHRHHHRARLEADTRRRHYLDPRVGPTRIARHLGPGEGHRGGSLVRTESRPGNRHRIEDAAAFRRNRTDDRRRLRPQPQQAPRQGQQHCPPRSLRRLRSRRQGRMSVSHGCLARFPASGKPRERDQNVCKPVQNRDTQEPSGRSFTTEAGRRRLARFPVRQRPSRINRRPASVFPVSRPARRSLAFRPAWSLSRPRRPFDTRVLQTLSFSP